MVVFARRIGVRIALPTLPFLGESENSPSNPPKIRWCSPSRMRRSCPSRYGHHRSPNRAGARNGYRGRRSDTGPPAPRLVTCHLPARRKPLPTPPISISAGSSIARREVRNPVDGIASFLPDINTPQQIASENDARSAILVDHQPDRGRSRRARVPPNPCICPLRRIVRTISSRDRTHPVRGKG